jgi:hypothetical protein
VADPGTSLITHRYIYFAGTLLGAVLEFAPLPDAATSVQLEPLRG